MTECEIRWIGNDELICFVQWCILNRNLPDIVFDPDIARRVLNAYAENANTDKEVSS